MMNGVVADTHAILWYLRAPERLSVSALTAFRDAVTAGAPIYLPSISVVELIYLVEKQRIPEEALTQLIDELTNEISPLTLAPLSLDIALHLADIPRGQVPDMPDRIIAATAMHLGLPLVTRDRRILAGPIQSIW